MKIVLLIALFVATTLASRCKPKYHFWRPYNGTIPNDAFVAGVDADGIKSYVAKIIPLDEYLWTIPAQMKENCDHVDLSWCCGYGKVMRVDKFIEILCTENPDNLVWKAVETNIQEAATDCCLVQGGIALYGGHIYVTHIARAERDGSVFIGRAYFERDWPGLHTMDGANSTKILKNYETLAYDCRRNEIVV